jgi:hypothetical protein
MAKKRRRVAPPPLPTEWDFTYLDMTAEEGWLQLCQQAPGPSRTAYEQIRREPRRRSDPDRQHRLRYEYSTKTIGGLVLEQWQYEVTGGSRVWYAIDDANRTVVMTHAGVGHPKQTD